MSSGLPSNTVTALLERRATLPLLDDPWIAGAGHRARPEVGADEHAVGPAPRHLTLGLRQRIAVFDKLLGRQIEFAFDVGVGTAP